MPTITLPDGNNLEFPNKTTGLEVAEKISTSLAKQAMIVAVDGQLKDLDFVIDKDCSGGNGDGTPCLGTTEEDGTVTNTYYDEMNPDNGIVKFILSSN